MTTPEQKFEKLMDNIMKSNKIRKSNKQKIKEFVEDRKARNNKPKF